MDNQDEFWKADCDFSFVSNPTKNIDVTKSILKMWFIFEGICQMQYNFTL